MYYAERLANWLVHLKYEDIPAEVVEKAKACIYDWVCITIYGADSPWSKALLDIVRETGGRKESTILVQVGKGDRLLFEELRCPGGKNKSAPFSFGKQDLPPACPSA